MDHDHPTIDRGYHPRLSRHPWQASIAPGANP